MRPPFDPESLRNQAFALGESLSEFQTDWHLHTHHQLLYAVSGVLHLRLDDTQWLLPPQRAAWIPGGIRHKVSAAQAALRTVYFPPEFLQTPVDTCCVFSITPLAREMILYAMRWGPEPRLEPGPAERFFAALADLSQEWVTRVEPWHLPVARSPELERVMQFALAKVSDPLEAATLTVEGAAKAAGMSVRTLSRRFQQETQMTWRQFVHHARLLRAMELLALPGARVTDVSFDVGFESPGAFSQAFFQFTGELPKDYRRRILGDDPVAAHA